MSVLKRSLRPWTLPGYVVRLIRGAAAIAILARRLRVDLIHTNMEVVLDGAIAASLLRLPHVLHYRGNTRDDPKLVFDVLTRIWVGLSDRVICISRLTQELFARRLLATRTEAIYDPFPWVGIVLRSRPPAVRRELGAAPDQLLVGTVARIHPRKDLLTFVNACRDVAHALPAARFVIVGAAHDVIEREYEAHVRATVRAAGLSDRIVFAGARSDIPQVMKALNLFVLCSRDEGFGRVVPEAMAAGVACVLADEGAFRELSDGGSAALLVRPGDPSAFAAAILRVLHDPVLGANLIRSGAALVDQFEPDRVAKAIFERYTHVLRNRCGRFIGPLAGYRSRRRAVTSPTRRHARLLLSCPRCALPPAWITARVGLPRPSLVRAELRARTSRRRDLGRARAA